MWVDGWTKIGQKRRQSEKRLNRKATNDTTILSPPGGVKKYARQTSGSSTFLQLLNPRIVVMETEGLVTQKKRPLETTESREESRREKRQKMGKKSSKKNEEQKKLKKRLREEAMFEIKPIALGSLAMIASTLSNQGEDNKCEQQLSIFIF